MKPGDVQTIEDLAQFIVELPPQDDDKAEAGFDMANVSLSETSMNHACGSAMCIGGWVEAITGISLWRPAFEKLTQHPLPERAVDSLCFPEVGYHGATPQQAAAALRFWADNGFDGALAWAEAMPEIDVW